MYIIEYKYTAICRSQTDTQTKVYIDVPKVVNHPRDWSRRLGVYLAEKPKRRRRKKEIRFKEENPHTYIGDVDTSEINWAAIKL